MSKMTNRKPKCGKGKRFNKRKNKCVDNFATKSGINTPGAVAGLIGVLGSGFGAYAKVKSDIKKQGG